MSCRQSAKQTLSCSVLNLICHAQLLSRLTLVKNQYFSYLLKEASSNDLAAKSKAFSLSSFAGKIEILGLASLSANQWP